jgi:hypothetical protein
MALQCLSAAQRRTMNPITRHCAECGQSFTISVEEQAFLRGVSALSPFGENGSGWSLPKRCTPCRFERRRKREAVAPDASGWYERTCCDCGTTFWIGPKDVEFLKARQWAWPRRCRLCRSAVKGFRESTTIERRSQQGR